MTDPVDRAFQELRREYLASLPARLDELRTDVAGVRTGVAGATASLQTRLHRLAGSGGSYGFTELSNAAREAERWLVAHPAATDFEGLDRLVERLIATAGRAEAELAGSAPAAVATITPRALVIMRSSPERDRIAQELRGAGYQVRFGSRQDNPADTPADELPHLVVIGGEGGDRDPSAVAAAWTSVPARRPGAVVLVESLRAVDRLRAVAAGIDAVFPSDQVHQKLPRYARTFARIGPPPSCVLLVEHDPSLASRIAAPLEEVNVRVVHCLPGAGVIETLERELPDLLLLNTRLGDADAFGLVRLVRQEPRYQLLPIVFLSGEDPRDRIDGLRAGGDDFLPLTADPELLAETVVVRSTRGRRVREMVYRDPVTGLLNHGTLMAELEYAIDHSRRYGEPLAFVLFELEGFRLLADRVGPRLTEEILLHIADIFRSNVRASDVIGRYGWEAFGILLRGGSAAGTTVLAEKLRRVLAEHPAQTSGGESVTLPITVGSAVFPRDGVSAAELVHVASKGVRIAGKWVGGQ
jgi:diguanylate cyclase (GGDEF)-like protein